MAFQVYKTSSPDSARRTQMAASLATPSPVPSQAGPMPDNIKALYDQYMADPNHEHGISNELYQYSQAHPEAGIDRSGYGYAPGSQEYKFYNPSAGQTPGVDWFANDDRNLPAGGFSGQQAASTAGQPYAPATNSPEANNAINHQGTATQKSNPLDKQPAYHDANQPTSAPPTQATQQPTFQPPLQLSGKSNQDQAKSLSDYLRSQGVEVGKMVVGGTSPYDNQINSLINQINDPNTQDAQRKIIAQQLGQLINQRNSSASGDVSQYDAATGTFNPVGAGGGQGGQQTPGLTTSPAIRAMFERLLGEFSSGSQEASDAQRRAQEGATITSAENASLAKRKALAERLNALGIQGGAASDALTQEENATAASRDQSISQLDAALMGQQAQSKREALSAFLQLQGLDTQTANNMAQLGLSRELGLANIGLGQRGQDINVDINNASNNQQLLIHLLDLAWAGDQAAQAKVDKMIQDLITSGGGA